MQNSSIKTADLNNALITKFVGANLKQDNIYPTNDIVPFSAISTLKSRKGYEKAIVVDGTVVNVVSDSYGHLPNEVLFGEVERLLDEANIQYVKRTINRENRSFAVDYIFNDDKYIIKVKNGIDKILPMLRFTNSYDSSNTTRGSFGVYRQVCTNGLFAFKADVGFKQNHSGKIESIILPKIANLTTHFTSNEYYTLSRKFEVLAERSITDLEGFVKLTAEKMGLFKYEMSEKNPMPSLNSRMVLDIIKKESELFGTPATLWSGYNAFNEVLHTKLKKNFDKQIDLDEKLFNAVLEMA